MRRNILVILGLMALAGGVAIPRTAWAAEPAPGDACSPNGIFTRAGGPETSGVTSFMVCQGGTWKAFMISDATGQLTKLGNQTCTAGQNLQFDGTKFACAAASSAIGVGLIVGGPANATITLNQYSSLVLGVNNNATESNVQQPVAAPGTFANFCIRTRTAQGVTSSVLTLRKNAADTTIAVTITANAAAGVFCDNTHSVSFAQGDLASVKVTGATTATITGWSINYSTALCADMTPDAYDFTDLINQATSTTVTSNIIQVTGLGCTATASVTGVAGTPQMRVCSASDCSSILFDWGSYAPVSSGNYVQLRMTTSATGGDPRTASVFIGNYGDGWTATPTGDCAAASPSIGTVCADGTIYAGLSPDGSEKMFTTHCDVGQTWNGTTCTGSRLVLPWNNGTTNWVDENVHSSVTGEANTYTLANSTDGGANYGAAKYCYDYDDGQGNTDWYLPSYDEYGVLNANKVAIGNFDTGGGGYWSSREENSSAAWYFQFNLGYGGSNGKNGSSLVRCVRREGTWASTGPATDGYFVLSTALWEGGWGGIAAANSACFYDLVNSDWKGKADAISGGKLIPSKVRVFECEGGNIPCQKPMASTTYAFAVLGDASKGGATFTANANGQGPGDSNAWSGSAYFGSVVNYWTGWDETNLSTPGNGTTLWGYGSHNNNNNGSCLRWDYGYGDKAARIGYSAATNSQRWNSGSLACDEITHVICMVDP